MKAQIYVNRHIMTANKKATKETGKLVDNPAIAVKTYKGSIYGKEIEFTGGCKLIQNAANARCSGATIWIEVEDFESLIIDGKIANRSLLAQSEEIDLEEYFWQFVEDAAWNKNQNYEAIALRLSSQYGADRRGLETMFRELQKKLMKKLDKRDLWLSDNGFDDFTAHIVGMGKEEYYRTLNELDRAFAYRNSFVKSFAYVLLNLRA